MLNRLLVPTDGSDISIAGALRAVPLAKMAGASITVLFVQDTYSYTGIGETNAAGLHAYMAAARAQGTSAIGRITDAAAAMGGFLSTPSWSRITRQPRASWTPHSPAEPISS